jgi:hypothetical protein
MKYLKSWSLLESITDKLRDLCDTSFANLYDDGFEVLPLDGNFRIDRQTMVKLKKTSDEPFTWSEIKDYYIPFLKLISNRYDLVSFIINGTENVRMEHVDWEYYSCDDLVNEVDEPRYRIFSISIIVTDKK